MILEDLLEMDGPIPTRAVIPNVDSKVIDLDGRVTDLLTGKVIHPKVVGESRFINLPLPSGTKMVVSVSTLHRVSFGSIQIPPELWSKLTFSPGAQTNMFLADPKNLKYTFGGIDYTIIPGFSLYGVSVTDEVYSLEGNTLLEAKTSANPTNQKPYVILIHDSSGQEVDVPIVRLKELISNQVTEGDLDEKLKKDL